MKIKELQIRKIIVNCFDGYSFKDEAYKPLISNNLLKILV